MPRYLLDTDTCIYIKNARPNAVRKRLSSLANGAVAVSTITAGELRFGAEKSQFPDRNHAALDQLFEVIPPIAIDTKVADFFGRIRNELRARGQMIGNNDLWIAAQAMAHKYVVVTNNEAEFRRVKGLKVENWSSP